MCLSVKLTVFFEEPFWVGVFEKNEMDYLFVCRVVFGAEPKDYEIYDLVLKDYCNLKFSSSFAANNGRERRSNPKRLQREVKKEVKSIGIGTKAQLAMKLQQEMNKVERRSKSREEKDHQKEEQFALRQQKKKEKHKGH
ncbi:YjdF family protein [Dehalobacter sp. DCM]|uniref:YjdF family protein n=1 Tax=Dehalobacter sp. DCM TaxID=2907827 RepID=UPI0030818545|nr:YjdF family protein [Dehalobacter sp. DCM]